MISDYRKASPNSPKTKALAKGGESIYFISYTGVKPMKPRIETIINSLSDEQKTACLLVNRLLSTESPELQDISNELLNKAESDFVSGELKPDPETSVAIGFVLGRNL